MTGAENYSRLNIGTPEKVSEGQYKVEVSYDLPGEQAKPEDAKVLAKSSSYGPTDPFAMTRDLSDAL